MSVASMESRPRIRRRMPNVKTPMTFTIADDQKITKSLKTVKSKTPVQPLHQNTSVGSRVTGVRKKSADRPRSGVRKDSARSADQDVDSEQQVRFIDVSGNGDSHPHSRIHTARETHAIDPRSILEKSQEKDSDKVYEIDLHASGIARISDLDLFSKLRVLDLSCNHIRHIDNLQYNPDIRELKLYDNDIESIENLDKLRELCHIQLQHNRIKEVGKGLQNQRKLRILRLDSNVLCRLEVREVASFSQLTSLDLSNNKLDNISAVNCLTSLEELFVINNRLRTVSDLSRCKKLQELDVSYNRITDLSGLKGLHQLTVLHTAHNQLTSIKSLGKLKKLEELNLANNRLTDVKELVDFYQSIQILDISENHIESWHIVRKLQSLSELVELYISGNPFSCIGGDKASYHSDIHKLLPNMDILDGAHLKKASSKPGTPLMRPMSASSILTTRQVESQLRWLDDEMVSFEKNLASQFESLRSTMEYLPAQGASTSGASESVNHATSPEARPSSRCGKRSRIKLAQEFAAHKYIKPVSEVASQNDQDSVEQNQPDINDF